jgi:hypothetical protein
MTATVHVRPVPAGEQIQHLCIEQDPKVLVADFLYVVEEGFERHGISTELVQADSIPDDCDYLLRYTAFQKWDLSAYLSHAELRLTKGRAKIASAEYHLPRGGGLSMKKFQGTRAKMDPVIDELLGGGAALH